MKAKDVVIGTTWFHDSKIGLSTSSVVKVVNTSPKNIYCLTSRNEYFTISRDDFNNQVKCNNYQQFNIWDFDHKALNPQVLFKKQKQSQIHSIFII